MFFLKGGEALYQRKIFLQFEREPVLNPDAALAGRESKGEIGGSDEFAGWCRWFLHKRILSLATDNCGVQHS